MKNWRILLAWIAATMAALPLLACSAPPAQTPPTSPTLPAKAAGPTKTPVEIPADAEKAVRWARADLERRLSVSSDKLELVAVEPVQWRDSSLGCPQPGMMYLQVITPGYRILLRSGDKVYAYHAAAGRENAILCTSGAEVPPPTSAKD